MEAVESEDNMDKVLTVKDVNIILGIGKNQTYSLMCNKSFPSYKIGNRYFITETELSKWLEKQKAQAITQLDDI